MLSIITAIHNGLAVNKIFLKYLKLYTFYPFELIIIDNCSTDGSGEFFKVHGAKVIKNTGNYSYPYCQNQGIKEAQYPLLAFLNNDIIVSPHWDKKLKETADTSHLEIICPCGIERIETIQKTLRIRQKWNLLKNIFTPFGYNETSFTMMHKLMYGNWEKFCNTRFQQFQHQVMEGFVGNTVFMYRTALEKTGLWDERVQAADFDLYIRAKKRHIETGDIHPLHIALGVFIHHFIRITTKSKPVPFKDKKNIITLEEKWGEKDIKKYLGGLELV